MTEYIDLLAAHDRLRASHDRLLAVAKEAELERLRISHAGLLAAAKEALEKINDDTLYRRLSDAIDAGKEQAP